MMNAHTTERANDDGQVILGMQISQMKKARANLLNTFMPMRQFIETAEAAMYPHIARGSFLGKRYVAEGATKEQAAERLLEVIIQDIADRKGGTPNRDEIAAKVIPTIQTGVFSAGS